MLITVFYKGNAKKSFKTCFEVKNGNFTFYIEQKL